MRFDAPFAVRRMLMLNYTTFLLQQGGGGGATGEINIMYLRSKEMKSALRPKNERALPEGVKEPLPLRPAAASPPLFRCLCRPFRNFTQKTVLVDLLKRSLRRSRAVSCDDREEERRVSILNA
jgi:hypothetical protein